MDALHADPARARVQDETGDGDGDGDGDDVGVKKWTGRVRY